MPVVVLDDGTHVDLPDEPKGVTPVVPRSNGIMPEWLKDAARYGPGFLGETGRKMGAETLGTWDKMNQQFSTLPGVPSLVVRAGRKAFPAKEEIEKIDIPDDPNAGKSTQYFNAAVRNMGRAAAVPVPMGPTMGPVSSTVANLAPAITGGLGGQAGGDYANSLSPKLKGVGEFLGNVLGSGITGFALGPKQTPARADIRKALSEATPDTFDTAQRKADAAHAAGATTNTAAEAFPANSAVMTLAEQARNGNLSNDLRTRTEGRPADLQNLGETFKDRINGPVDPNQVANSAAGSANSVMDVQRNTRSNQVGSTLANQKVTDRQVIGIYSDLYNIAQAQDRPGARAAYETVAEALRTGPNGGPITNVQQLSLAIKALREGASNPNSPLMMNGRGFDKVDLEHAIGAADTGLRQASPAYNQAMNQFKQYSEQVITPTRQGPIGTLADKNPLTAGQTPATRLSSLLTGNSPQTVKNTADRLNSPLFTGGNTTDPMAIARAIAEQKLGKGQTNPGSAMRGNPGSDAEAQFNALLEAGGGDINHINAPLKTADDLQAFAGPAGRNEPPKIGLAQFIRPFRSADMIMTGNTMRSTNKELSALLADPKNIPELQRIAMFDPNLRRALTMRGLILPAVNAKTGE